MAKPNPAARESLLEAAQHLMLAQGFAATTVDHICQAAAVTKGAFFHYFKSKDELAKATFDRFCRRGGDRYQRAPFLKKPDPLERLNGYVDFTIAQVKHPLRDSCLVGMFSQELADSHPMFRTMCDDAFTQWAAGLKTMLDEVKKRYAPRARIDTRSLAEHFLAVFEGSLILAKARNDVAPVKAQLGHFKRYVNTLFKGNEMSGDRRRFTLAFFAYLIITFVVATVWHLVLFKDLYMTAGMRREPLMHLGILSMLIQAFLMAFLYPRIRGAGSPPLEGLKFGLLMGLFMGSYGVLAEAGKFDVGPVGPFIATEGAFFLLQFAIVGTAIGLLYGRGEESS